MATIRTEAIVISGFSFGESHKIITLFTPNEGIIKGVAHGIRKPGSRFASSFEMLTCIDLLAASSKSGELYTIKEASAISYFDIIKKEKGMTGYLFYLTEFINEFFKDAPANLKVYSLIKTFLFEAEKGNSYNMLIALIFKILGLSGFLPEVGVCYECHKESDVLFMQMPGCEIVCPECLKQHGAMEISKANLKIYRLLGRENIKSIKNLKLNTKQKYFIDALLCDIVSSILGKALKSQKFLYLNH
jgi:DNA repair protein RecO (recombination protein O)